jgi:hypothetical protein
MVTAFHLSSKPKAQKLGGNDSTIKTELTSRQEADRATAEANRTWARGQQNDDGGLRLYMINSRKGDNRTTNIIVWRKMDQVKSSQ